MCFSQRVRQRRIELGMTQDELAKKMGYSSRSSINKIENGRNVTQKIIVKLANVLQTTPSYLMGWEQSYNNKKEQITHINNEDYVDIYNKITHLDDDNKKKVEEYIDLLLLSQKKEYENE